MSYLEIASKIERLEHQTAIINQIFNSKKYVRLLREFQDEGIIIISDNKEKDNISAKYIK